MVPKNSLVLLSHITHFQNLDWLIVSLVHHILLSLEYDIICKLTSREHGYETYISEYNAWVSTTD